jgi:hypothetical protein
VHYENEEGSWGRVETVLCCRRELGCLKFNFDNDDDDDDDNDDYDNIDIIFIIKTQCDRTRVCAFACVFS